MATAVNIQTILPGLKQMSEEGLREQFEQEGPTYTMFAEGGGEFVNGKGWRIPSYFRPPTGVSGIAEGGSFNQPTAFTADDMFVSPMNINIPFEITGSALRNVEDASSLIKHFSEVLERHSMALKKEANRQAFNDGSGQRAIYKSGTTTLTLYNQIAHTPLAGYGSTKGAAHLEVGERYDAYDTTLATLRASAVSISSKTNTTAVIPAAIAGATDGDILVLSNSLYKVPRGLPYIVNNDTGTYQLQSRSTYPQLKAVVEDLAGVAVTVSTFNKTKRSLVARAGAGKARVVVGITGVAQDQALVQLGQNFKRFAGNDRNYDGSFDTFTHGDTVIKVDPDCCEDRIYLVVPGEIKRYKQKEFGLYNEDGNEIRMRAGVSGYGSDAFTGVLGAWYNLGAAEPRNLALIKRAAVAGLSGQCVSQA